MSMAESVFEAVKQSVAVREAAQMYGIEVNRSGMACCPFHDDKNPSMKLNEEYFYCFGCGATGDVIDFTARLYNLSPKRPPRSWPKILAWLMTVRPLPGGAMSGGNPRPRNSRRTGTMPFVSWPTTFICSASGKRTTHPKHRRKIHIPDSWRQSRKKTMWAICWIFSWRIPLMNKDCGLPNINQKSPIWKGE